MLIAKDSIIRFSLIALTLTLAACFQKTGKDFRDLAEAPKLVATIAGCEAYSFRDERGVVYLIVKGVNCTATGGR